MKVPLLRIVGLGAFSTWARQLFDSLVQKEIIEISMEPDLFAFEKSLSQVLKPTIVCLENTIDSKKQIEKICSLGRAVYIVWMGKSFTKEELNFAIQNRIYTVIESAKYDEKSVISNLNKLSQLIVTDSKFHQILRAMKSIMVQFESEFPEVLLLTELRNAVRSLEKQTLQNEFNHLSRASNHENSEALFHSEQLLGDAISTVYELERTGVLWVRDGGSDQNGKIEFFQGKIVQAVAGGCDGRKSIFRMFLWDQPRFLFNRKDPREIEISQHMESDIQFLVKKGYLYKQKFEQIRKRIPLPSFKLEVVPGSLNKDLMLAQNDFSVLSSVIEFGTVSTLVDFNPLPDVEIYESLINLKGNNIIRKTHQVA